MLKKFCSFLLCSILLCLSHSGSYAQATGSSSTLSEQDEIAEDARKKAIFKLIVTPSEPAQTEPVAAPVKIENSIIPRLLIWVLLLGGLFGYGKMWINEKSQPEVKPANANELTGIKGWLRFFVSTIGIVVPLFAIGSLNSAFIDAERSNPLLMSLEQWHRFKDAEFLSLGLFSGFLIYVALQLRFIWKPTSVKLAKVALVLSPIMVIITNFVLPALILSSDGVDALSLITGLIIRVVLMMVWLSYLSNSSRVEATYFSSGQSKPAASLPVAVDLRDMRNVSATKTQTQPVTQAASEALSLQKNSQPKQPLQATVSASKAPPPSATLKPVISPKQNTVPPEKFWAASIAEFDSSNRRSGVWARAYAQAQGDEAKAKADYLQTRAYELYQDHQAQIAMARARQQSV